jgi:outer membrane lipoprotein SlyB
MSRTLNWIVAALAVLVLAACATPQPTFVGNGTVVSISESKESSQTANAVGAVGGALLGGLLGSQIGGGTGQTIATGVGAVGGAMAGKAVAGNVAAESVWRVVVRFEDGIDRTIATSQRPNFRPGDRVRVSGDQIAKL